MKTTMPIFSKISKIDGFSTICLIRKIAMYACGITTSETPIAYLLSCSFPFSKLIFNAVMFSMLGVIEPKKEKINPKKKCETKIIAYKLKGIIVFFKTTIYILTKKRIK